ncbi:MAG: hypothetical protein GF417_10455 [Candidatus Latescibacteria bacterium]|nr:hypothetical protein [bacterium]MBD3424848.1 hypothetical protein [Candidatus Latescibacterota bacterium]
MNDLEGLFKKESVKIVGIEPGNISGKAGAIITRLEGNGADTVCDLEYYTSREMPGELVKMLKTVDSGEGLSVEDVAGVNFLFLHHLSSLYGQIFDEIDLLPEDIDLVGLKQMEVKGHEFPMDPADFSEMIDNIVISRFSIDMGDSVKTSLPVEESVFRTLVAEMIEEIEFEDEAREALGVALFANESFRNRSWARILRQAADSGPGAAAAPAAEERMDIVFNGEFYLPSR